VNGHCLQAQEAARKGQRTQLSSIKPIEAITARDVAAAARLGDLVAQQILTHAGTYVDCTIAAW